MQAWRIHEISYANSPQNQGHTPKGPFTTLGKVKNRKKMKKEGKANTQTSSNDVSTAQREKQMLLIIHASSAGRHTIEPADQGGENCWDI